MSDVHILTTDDSCFIGGRSFEGIPLLISEDDEIFTIQSDYLRHIRISNGMSRSTVLEYAKYLRRHIEIMMDQGCKWELTTEGVLRDWRNFAAGKKPTGATKRYLNQQLGVIYQFLIWAQRRGLISQVVGPLTPGDTFAYPLPVELSERNKDGSAARIKYPLLYKTVRESYQRNATTAEMDQLFVAIAEEIDPYIADRNLLIARFAENGLMRRSEILALCHSQLPSRDTAIALRSGNEEGVICLTITKGNKAREALLDPQLIVDTWDFIDGRRSDLLLKKKIYDSADLPIFLSSTTAKGLHPDSISNLFAKKQKIAGIDDASIHHLRSFGATKRVESVFAMYVRDGAPIPDEDTLLLQVQESLGHSSVETTRKYIRRERKRQADRQKSQHQSVVTQEERLTQLNREIAIQESKLANLRATISKSTRPETL